MLTHRVQNWKARLSAYNDVIAKSAKTASDTDPFFRPFIVMRDCCALNLRDVEQVLTG
jgi:hypothetical protein